MTPPRRHRLTLLALARSRPDCPTITRCRLRRAHSWARPRRARRSRAGRPIVATTYFYWYDAATNEHIIDGDGTDALTDHPPTLEGFSYRNVDWHARQLDDMIASGIDVALPVYWGEPSENAAGVRFQQRGPAQAGRRSRATARRGQDAAADRHVLRHQHPAAQRQALPRRSDHPDRPALVLRHDPRFLLADPAGASGDHRRQADRLPLRPRRSPRTSTPRCFRRRGRCFARISEPTCTW